MADVLRKFGRYFLLDQLAQGGMADIFRARLAAQDGAGRLLAIKRIQTTHGNNKEFLAMFRTETKVMMGFNHSNVIQLYDFGEEQGQPFIAMELVDGKTLRQFISRYSEQGLKFPVDLACYVAMNSAAGLHYAHVFKDKLSGNPLDIVHRDVSPQNILISFDGSVKVIDFGIAKASTGAEATRAGVIKGKPSYLSPEQISGESLDGQCDVFALGVVLWEMLAGRKLFAADNDIAVLKLIESCQSYVKPPSNLNRDVPKELDYIVLKALAKDRRQRYATAEDLQRALSRFIASHNAELSSSDLAQAAKELFKNEIVEDRKELQRLVSRAEQLLLLDYDINHESDRKVAPELGTGSTGSRNFEATAVGLNNIQVDITPELRKKVQRQRPGSPVGSQQAGPEPKGPPVQQRYQPSGRPGARSNSSQSEGRRPWVAAAAAAAAFFYFYGGDLGIMGSRDPSKSQRAPTSVKKVEELLPKAAQSIAQQASLVLNFTPSGGSAVVLVNGKPVDGGSGVVVIPADGVLKFPVAVESALEFSVEAPGFAPLRRELAVSADRLGAGKEIREDVQLEPLRFGLLSATTTSNAVMIIAVEGSNWVYKSSLQGKFENIKVPSGTYDIEFKSELLGLSATVLGVSVPAAGAGDSVRLPEVRLR